MNDQQLYKSQVSTAAVGIAFSYALFFIAHVKALFRSFSRITVGFYDILAKYFDEFMRSFERPATAVFGIIAIFEIVIAVSLLKKKRDSWVKGVSIFLTALLGIFVVFGLLSGYLL